MKRFVAVFFIVMLVALPAAAASNRIVGYADVTHPQPYGILRVQATCGTSQFKVTVGAPGMSYGLDVGVQAQCNVWAEYRTPAGTLLEKSPTQVVAPVFSMNRVDLVTGP